MLDEKDLQAIAQLMTGLESRMDQKMAQQKKEIIGTVKDMMTGQKKEIIKLWYSWSPTLTRSLRPSVSKSILSLKRP